MSVANCNCLVLALPFVKWKYFMSIYTYHICTYTFYMYFTHEFAYHIVWENVLLVTFVNNSVNTEHLCHIYFHMIEFHDADNDS